MNEEHKPEDYSPMIIVMSDQTEIVGMGLQCEESGCIHMLDPCRIVEIHDQDGSYKTILRPFAKYSDSRDVDFNPDAVIAVMFPSEKVHEAWMSVAVDLDKKEGHINSEVIAVADVSDDSFIVQGDLSRMH